MSSIESVKTPLLITYNCIWIHNV